MANMDFCDKHNMVAFLQKPTGSEEFHQIVDFLAGSHIRYALTANPTIYVSLIEQFWQTVTVDTVNDGEQQLIVIVDGQTIAITEASVRRHLQLADAYGISSLPNTEIFDQLTLMGYVSNDDKLTFQKVTSLEDDLKQTKKIYGKALTKLVKKVKQLEAKLKSTTERRKAMMVIYDDEEDMVSALESNCFPPTKVTQGEEQCQESSEAQLSVLSAAKILADASRERVKTYTRRRSTYSSRDSTAGGLFSTAEEVQGKEQIITDEKEARKLNDKEMARAAAREEQERIDFEKALELQKQLDEREETDNIDWNTVAEQVQERQSDTIKRYQTLKKKPISVAQARKNMMIYLKNMAGYKMKDTKVKKTKTKRIAEETLLQESFKKLRTSEASRLAEPIEDKERALWVELKRLFELDKDDMLWKLQRYMYDPLTWRLYGICGVHHVSLTRGHDIYTLIEMDYPLSTAVMNLMLSRRLQVEEDSEMAKDLIMKIFIEANKPRR
ncbi:hypothetical protein Tco_0039283 [Tanacetum coccineum]